MPRGRGVADPILLDGRFKERKEATWKEEYRHEGKSGSSIHCSWSRAKLGGPTQKSFQADTAQCPSTGSAKGMCQPAKRSTESLEQQNSAKPKILAVDAEVSFVAYEATNLETIGRILDGG